AFVLFGLIAILLGWVMKWDWVRNRWFRGFHLAMIAIVVLEAWAGITCPLTTWENELRKLAGQTTHRASFVADFVHELMFFESEPWVFTISYTLLGAAGLGTLFLVPPRWRGPSRETESSSVR